MNLSGWFVTGTDTGVGKTVVTAGLVASLRASGVDALGLKPVVTGTHELADPGWPADHELLASIAGVPAHVVNCLAYGPPVSPHLAAELSGRPLQPGALLGWIDQARRGREALLVEGVGGLLVPLGDGYDVANLAAALGLPLVIVARAGLGTINHTLLTLETARRRRLEVACVVLNRWPAEPDVIARSNRTTIERLGKVRVVTFPEVRSPEPGGLAAAGAALAAALAAPGIPVSPGVSDRGAV